MSDLPNTVPGVVHRAAELFGDREGMVDGDLRLSFAEFAGLVDRASRAFIGTGIDPGDRIGIWAPNVYEWAVAALGAHGAGAIVVPLNTRFKGNEAAYVLARSGARMVFCVSDFLDTDYLAMLEGADGLEAVEERVILRGGVPDGATGFDEFLARGDRVDDDERQARAAALGPDDIANILFTSGTTGLPKGAMLAHGPTVKAYDAWATVVGLTEGDRYLVVNPFFHSFGLNAGILAALIKGATIIPHPVFDVPAVMRRVVEERVSMLPGPPAVFQTILNHPDLDSFDLSSLRLSVTGAASIPVELIVKMREVLGFENVVTGYGLTEATGIATMCRHDDDPETIATTSGRPIPDVEVEIHDPEGRALAAGETGEIVVRGYTVMKGYLDDPEQTAEAIDEDGWLHTGDVGHLTPDGNLCITDRLKDMYIIGGFNAYPAEIENILSNHPDVAQAAVTGVPDERMGEVGMAFVVPRAGAVVDPDELSAWSRENMANYKVPRYVQVVDQLPLNASGKVLKYELRERADAVIAQK